MTLPDILWFLNAIPPAVGWFVAAVLAYGVQMLTERARGRRVERATRRQIRALLRAGLETLKPWFYSFKELQFHDVRIVYDKFFARLAELNTAAALTDAQYDACVSFLEEFGKAIALGQQLVEHQDRNQCPDPGLRRKLGETFADTLPFLAKVIDEVAADDADLKTKMCGLRRLAENFLAGRASPPSS